MKKKTENLKIIVAKTNYVSVVWHSMYNVLLIKFICNCIIRVDKFWLANFFFSQLPFLGGGAYFRPHLPQVGGA